MTLLVLSGSSALSDFRISKFNQRLAAADAAVRLTHATLIYLIEIEGEQPLSESERSDLQSLLNADGALAQMPAHSVLIVPRLGSISSWSSKATDIAAHCGMDRVKRIELGRLLQLDGGPVRRTALHETRLVDRMTESVLRSLDEISSLFDQQAETPVTTLPLLDQGVAVLEQANQDLGLALSSEEIDYLDQRYRDIDRNPTDAELMMFAQANSEHCRHKIFNASWTLDGESMPHSLFGMIRNTYQRAPEGIITAYSDNSAIIEGHLAHRLIPDPLSGEFELTREPAHIAIKVETHNHPTAISPHAGAATGSGGEIRDEAATGRGARPKAGLTGFSVSNLNLPDFPQSWETAAGKPDRIASAMEIMLEAPIGAAGFNNEFGRPALGGYFRTFEQTSQSAERWYGYHKPIMIAGGLGSIRPEATRKLLFGEDTPVIVLGGPAMLIGLGGGAASSMSSGSSDQQLDFSSVQRDNPEMQRRCQEVIDRCWSQGEANPIVSIHDVGAGGLSNAIPELLHDADCGGELELRRIHSDDRSLTPMQIWSNEAQERYVLAVDPARLEDVLALCERERCPVAVVGTATSAMQLRLNDRLFDNQPVDIPMDLLFGSSPRLHREDVSRDTELTTIAAIEQGLDELIDRVLAFPAVASKKFLITIGDRSVGGLVHRDQMVGPWQVPVADCAVTLNDFEGSSGEAMAMGERTPLALIDAPASGRMAVAEAITNMAGVSLPGLSAISLSANWMAAAGQIGEESRLYRTVEAVGMEFCPALGIAIPVGKDSLSMTTTWDEQGTQRQMQAPVSLIVSAFAAVKAVEGCLTPQLLPDPDSVLLLIAPMGEQRRLGGSSLLQTLGGMLLEGDRRVPDIDPEPLKQLFDAVQAMNAETLLTACHDRSDGGLITTLLEMGFAGRCGLRISCPDGLDPLAFLFNEEIGLVVQCRRDRLDEVNALLDQHDLKDRTTEVAVPAQDARVVIEQGGHAVFESTIDALQQRWASVSFHMQQRRDHPQCAEQEFSDIIDQSARLYAEVPASLRDLEAPAIVGSRPKIAVLREQGVNGHNEMAAAFHYAGFQAVDVHMSDLLSGRQSLDRFNALVACGGFSYGDVLGAGQGWARTILMNEALRAQFQRFFADTQRFALGVCNGCQMLSTLAPLIPGAEDWPRFVRNRSEQFEARLSMVEVQASRSILFEGMAGLKYPIIVSHGEGRASFSGDAALAESSRVMRYVDRQGQVATTYPANPNGSPDGLTAICNDDGRITAMMPHPERVFRRLQMSWSPESEGQYTPWMALFLNGRRWLN